MYVVPNNSPVRARALIVEDDQDVQYLLRCVLARRGFVVTTANDGAEGLALARMFLYDIIVTDVMMPRLSGPEMVAGVRAHERAHNQARVPIIALTASATSVARESCATAGVTAFLRKPLNVARLESLLKRTVDTRACTLVVSDSAEARARIVSALDTVTRIVEVEDVYRALERVRSQRVDVVVMDADWAGRDELSLADRLRQNPAFAHTPIIAVTQRNDAGSIRRSARCEALSVSVKAIDELGEHVAACA